MLNANVAVEMFKQRGRDEKRTPATLCLFGPSALEVLQGSALAKCVSIYSKGVLVGLKEKRGKVCWPLLPPNPQ